MTCDTTVLTGTSGAFYYKPANTEVCLTESAFPATGATSPANGQIAVGSYMGFRVNDPVTLAYPAGATTTGAIAAGAYFVKTYDATTGIMTISSSAGGAVVTAPTPTTRPSGFGNNKATISYSTFAAVGQVREFSFEITRSEIDVTTLGQGAGQYAPFRQYQTGYAEGTGSATVYFTDDDTSSANRMIEDVLQRRQTGAAVKLYVDAVYNGATIDETLSRSIQAQIVLTSANFTVNPDDAIAVSINFRPSSAPTFDFARS